MPSFLPERYESKEMVSRMKEEEGIKEIEAQGLRRKDRRKAIHEIKKQNNEHQRIQNTMTNQFLSYINLINKNSFLNLNLFTKEK